MMVNISKYSIRPSSLFMAVLAMVLYCSTAFGQGVTAGGTSGAGGTSNMQGSGLVTVSSIAVNPANQSQNVGQTIGYSAIGTLSNGLAVDLTASATWTISNQAIANFVNLSTGPPALENIQCISASTVQISAVYAGVSGSTTLTCAGVLPPTPTPVSLALAPVNPSISAGQALQFTATETYSDGSTQNV